MLDTPTAEAAAPVVRTTQILVAALTAGLTVMTVILAVIRLTGGGPDEVNSVLGFIAIGFFLAVATARGVTLSTMATAAPTAPSEAAVADSDQPAELLAPFTKSWQTRQIVGAAMIEGPSLLCAIMGLIGPSWALAGAVVGIVWLLLSVPSMQSFGGDIAASRQLDPFDP